MFISFKDAQPHNAPEPVLKRPAGAAPAAAKHIAKKPAMSTAVSSNRPYSGQVTKPDMEDIFNELRESFGKISRGAFVTKAYKRAEQRAFKAGMTIIDTKLFARTNHLRAANLFAQMTNSNRE